MTMQEELEAVRVGLRSADLEAARAEIGKAGAGVINRFEFAWAPDSTDSGFIGSVYQLLGTEACARLLTLAEDDAIDSPEAEAIPSGVGGALDAAQHCFEQRDTEGARRFIEAAMDVLGL
jgi:hypothetical protein